MKLRNQLLALSLLTLLLPWSGWKLVQELENFLRESEENALLASARIVSQSLPPGHRQDLQLARGQILPLRQLPASAYWFTFVTSPRSVRPRMASNSMATGILA